MLDKSSNEMYISADEIHMLMQLRKLPYDDRVSTAAKIAELSKFNQDKRFKDTLYGKNGNGTGTIEIEIEITIEKNF